MRNSGHEEFSIESLAAENFRMKIFRLPQKGRNNG